MKCFSARLLPGPARLPVRTEGGHEQPFFRDHHTYYGVVENVGAPRRNGEASNWAAPLGALALNLIVPAAIMDAGAWGFAEIVLFVAAFGALVAALACSKLEQRPPWQAEHRPRGFTTILVEFSWYLIGFLMICLVAWRVTG